MSKINFISHVGPFLASRRMRVDKPSSFLEMRGHEVTVDSVADKDADVNVFGKHFNGLYDHTMMQLLEGKTKRVFDVCDDHFEGERGDYYKTMCGMADEVICNGPNLKQRIKEITGIDAKIVKDPVTFPRYEPKLNLESPRLLWFGHYTNIEALDQIVHDLKYPLHIITNNGIDTDIPTVTSELWQPGLVEQNIQFFDIVIIPMSSNKQNKNANRGIDALNSGRFVVTDSHKVYKELQDFAFVGGNIMDGIEWAIKNKNKISRMIKKGQEYIDNVYSDIKIGDEWEEALLGKVTRGRSENFGGNE